MEQLMRSSKDVSSAVPEQYVKSIKDLFRLWSSVSERNRVLSNYYRMKIRPKDLGISTPHAVKGINSIVGWADKAVRVMAVRSKFDGFVTGGRRIADLDALCAENALSSLYDDACISSLIHGVSAMTVMRGNTGESSVKVRVFSANQCAMLWDKDLGDIGCGIVLSDADGSGNPLKYVAHFPDAVLTISRPSVKDDWFCSVEENPQGTPLMVPFIYDPDADRPLGHSRITPEVMGIIDKAMRDVQRMEIGAEFFTFPQRYILGIAKKFFKKKQAENSEHKASPTDDDSAPADETLSDAEIKRKLANSYIGSMLAISRDETGELPQVGQFQAAQAENFVTVFENDAQRFSGATNVPLGQLGVLSNTYTSSDALGAANDPLVLDVQAMNSRNRVSLEKVARLMMAIAQNTTVSELSHEEKNVIARFDDPSMQTMAARVDAWSKIGALDTAIVGTPVWYEQMNIPKETVDRIMQTKRDAEETADYRKLIFGEGESGDKE